MPPSAKFSDRASECVALSANHAIPFLWPLTTVPLCLVLSLSLSCHLPRCAYSADHTVAECVHATKVTGGVSRFVSPELCVVFAYPCAAVELSFSSCIYSSWG